MLKAIGWSLLATTLAVSGCASPNADQAGGGDGKADDFLSDSAREFVVEGRSFVTVEEDVAESKKMERALQLIKLKHIALAWFINQFLEEDQDEMTQELFGFGAMVKTGSIEDLAITQINDRSFEFTFRQIIAGKRDLFPRLKIKDGGSKTIEIGKPTNEEMEQLETNAEWYREEPWEEWDPKKVAEDKKEKIKLTFTREKITPDAWWDYNRLIEDGVLTIDVHFGWDFHDNLHLKQSEDLYNWLTEERDFESPVDEFAQINRRSRPLTKTMEMNGKDVEIQVRIFYGRPGTVVDTDTDEGGKNLEEDMRASLADRDIIVYTGHSGPFFGFALANWRETDEGDLDDSEMPRVKMPADKYQIVIGNGCDTLMIGPAFLSNTNKKGKNIDVLTSTTISDAERPPIISFLTNLLERDSQGRHRPRTIRSLLADLDPATMYGVHGVNDNPQLHPYAVVENFCKGCDTHADCGGAGNACIPIGDSARRCSAACTTDAACSSGFVCRQVESGTTVFGKMCVPRDLQCKE